MNKSGFRITRADFQVLCPAQYRVLELLSDEKWHSRDEVQLAAGRNGVPAVNGVGRLRELRPRLGARGYAIPCRRIGNTGSTEYRLMSSVEVKEGS
jgi:hypothetical protein